MRQQLSSDKFLRAAATTAAGVFGSPLLGAADRDWSGNNPVRYPDPTIEQLDPRFGKCIQGNASVQRLWTGARWAEGPVWFGNGNVWAAAGWGGEGYDGVHIFAPDGNLISRIQLPETCANLCFGGAKRNRLFMAASQSLYAVYVNTQGAQIP